MTEAQMLIVAAAFLLAGFSKGCIGMGLPPIAIGIMSFNLPLADAIAIMTLPTIATNVWQAVYGGHFFTMLRRFAPMCVATMVGVFATAIVAGKLGAPGAVGWLGLILAIYAMLALLAFRPRVARRHEGWANPLIGVASGAVAGVTGIAAIPFLPYMQALELGKDELVQALGILFICITAALALALAGQGTLAGGTLLAGVAANIPTFLGMWLGQKLRNAASPETFRRIFLLGMLCIGVHMARGLF